MGNEIFSKGYFSYFLNGLKCCKSNEKHLHFHFVFYIFWFSVSINNLKICWERGGIKQRLSVFFFFFVCFFKLWLFKVFEILIGVTHQFSSIIHLKIIGKIQNHRKQKHLFPYESMKNSFNLLKTFQNTYQKHILYRIIVFNAKRIRNYYDVFDIWAYGISVVFLVTSFFGILIVVITSPC